MIDLSNLSAITALVAVGIAGVIWKLISVRRFYKDLVRLFLHPVKYVEYPFVDLLLTAKLCVPT